jgi:hypothetical protein
MGWLWKKVYEWCVKRRECRIDKCYERTNPARVHTVDISEYVNTKVSPMCDACRENHSEFCVTSIMRGNGPRDRNYCRDCFTIGGKHE